MSDYSQLSFIKQTQIGITVAFVATVMSFFLSACVGGAQNEKVNISAQDSLPDLRTLDVNTVISDSGILKYKLVTPEWCIYKSAPPARWTFEKGVYLEQFDSLGVKVASIKSDTAYFMEEERLWKLFGNVHIQNREGVKFDTQRLFWDQRTQRIHSDVPVKIVQDDKILTGDRFESNQEMTDYVLYNSQGSGIFQNPPAPAPSPAPATTGVPSTQPTVTDSAAKPSK